MVIHVFRVSGWSKYRSSLNVVACLWPYLDLCPAFSSSKKRFKILEITLCETSIASATLACPPPNRPTTLQASVRLNFFIEISHSSKQHIYRMSVILFCFVFH
ncbi:hypothetical protein TNCT_312621 [Trichonephila clavata]|uniref:Uncharacterized protein n=1 Tax=Trichonephila clavata TaxID=2740835 RepID=A0A8X6LQI3_TRICU|nr:hypothetical protein TNCT_312621 [Trichonephila clavata]